MRIVVVDDEPDERAQVELALRRELATVELVAAVGADGLERALAEPRPDALITEHRLSWSSGFEVAARARSRWPGLPVLMVTGHGSEELAVAAIRAGLDDYLSTNAESLARLPSALSSAVEAAIARQQLQETEHRYRELFEALPIALYLSFADGVLLGANPAMVQLLGYPDRETLLGTNMGELYCDPLTRDRWMAEVLREGIVRGFEAELRRFDGSQVLVRESTRAVWGDDGATVLFQGSLEDISERRRAEQALHDSEAKFRTLFELARDSIFLLENDRFVECNSSTREMFRCQPGEILGRSPSDFSPAAQPDGGSSRDRALELLAAALAGQPQYFEWQHRRADGSVFDAEVSLDGVTLAGRPYVQAMVRDVTDRRRAEEALRRRAAILDAVALAAARILQAESWHDAVGEVLGRLGEAATASRAYLVRGVGSGAVFSEEAERVEWVSPGLEFSATGSAARGERWLEVLAGGAVVAGPVRNLPANQAGLLDEAVVSVALVPVMVEGRLWGYIGFDDCFVEREWSAGELEALRAAADILGSAIHLGRTREILEASEAQYREFVDQLPEGVILLDGERRVVLANPVAREALQVLGGEDQGVLKRIGEVPLDVLLEGRGDRPPLEVASEGARPRVFEARARAVAGAEGALWVVVLGEVTGEREAKRQLQIQERLAAVGQLAAGIAHDFNNMLQTIVLHCELARRQAGAGDLVVRRLDPIERQCAHGTTLIRQILDFARKTVTQPQSMDLVPFVHEAARLLARTIPERVVIRVEGETEGCSVVGDPGQLQQLLTNLATNASDAMPEGGELSIRLRRLVVGDGVERTVAGLAPGGWVELEVADTGCGMSPSVRERVFEPFFTTKQPGQGTGLGLAQVYGIVQQHAGSVAVTSREGAGTTFQIYLPLAAGVPPAVSQPVSQGPPQDGRGELVLVAEDDEAILELARDGLETLGYQVVAAADGAGAMAAMERHRDGVVLILSDMVMPGVGGVELARRVREAGLHPRVVLMTGYPLEGDAGELERLGVVACLRKPFTMAQLAGVVHDALRGTE